MYLVFAGSYAQYETWRRDKSVHPNEAIYISTAERLRGIRFHDAKIIRYGTYYMHPDRWNIEQQLRIIENAK